MFSHSLPPKRLLCIKFYRSIEELHPYFMIFEGIVCGATPLSYVIYHNDLCPPPPLRELHNKEKSHLSRSVPWLAECFAKHAYGSHSGAELQWVSRCVKAHMPRGTRQCAMERKEALHHHPRLCTKLVCTFPCVSFPFFVSKPSSRSHQNGLSCKIRSKKVASKTLSLYK